MELFTLTESAAAARVSAATMFRRMRDGSGPRTVKQGRLTFVHRADLRAWLDSLPPG